MFDTSEFRTELTAAISGEASRNGLGFEDTIIDYLRNLAVENENFLMEQERKKATGRRGIVDALESAALLTREASRYVSSDRRKTITLSDIQAAYKAKFCRVWPFCK
jgi:hypothetical protein